MDYHPNETARKIAEESFSTLRGDLAARRNDALVSYLEAMSRHRGFSWQNTLLIAAQRPDAKRVASIHAWNDLGRSVKPGEKGVLIFAPLGYRMIGFDPVPRPGRAVYVFDITQTEGKRLPAFDETRADLTKLEEHLRSLFARQGHSLRGDLEFSGTHTWKLDANRAASVGASVQRLIHALASEMAGQRSEAVDRSRDAVDAKAHAIALVVTRTLGIETDRVGTELLRAIGADAKALARALAVIQETSAAILDELYPLEHLTSRDSADELPRSSPKGGFLDADRFAILHQQHHQRVVARVVGMVRDRDNAEDIAARAFQLGWEKRDTFRGDASPQTWIHSIARNAALDHHSRNRSFESIDRNDAPELAAREQFTEELERRDEVARLQSALLQIPTKYRRCLTAHFIEGLSVREIARRARVPCGTVLSRIHTGKQLLREAWDETSPALRADQAASSKPPTRDPPRDRELPEGRGDVPTPDPASWER